MSLVNAEPANFLPKRAIGPFNATITIEESSSHTQEITQHPVQQGGTISDHTFSKPTTVDLKVAWNDDDAPLGETLDKLLKLQVSGVPFTLITGKRSYKNMLISYVGPNTDETKENILYLTMSLQQITITTLEIVTVQSREKHKAPSKTAATQNAGQKSVEAAPKNQSALLVLSGRGR